MTELDSRYDVIIIGAGAAGLMCALTAGKRGRKVLVIDHANKAGKKILMSGGGRCNFTNLDIQPENYLSHNSHFCKSALSRYTQWDFIALVEKHQIPYHEKTLGQLFCDHKSSDILNMLLDECRQANVAIKTHCQTKTVQWHDQLQHYVLETSSGTLSSKSVVIATGGLSIPTLGASGFGYDIAQQFNLKCHPTRAGLVPFTLAKKQLEIYKPLAGSSINVEVSIGKILFKEAMLFTHRGFSGPAMLQLSSYWQPGQQITINLIPGKDVLQWLKSRHKQRGNAELKSILSEIFSKNISQIFCEHLLSTKGIENAVMKTFNLKQLEKIEQILTKWTIVPAGTEGYRTAEVTLGGIDTNEVSSKTFESKKQPGLYFIGEVLDVIGHLGGYNFQWAWSSGAAAGQHV